MKTRLRFLLLIFIAIASIPANARAEEPLRLSQVATISLLTCSPGEAIWAQYGHSAIRVCDPVQQIDVTFNYGIFDFNSKNFIWRFVKGQTDYILGAYNTKAFLREYQEENRRVTEQVLNLTQVEKENLWNALCKNSQPENRTYRYNFFYDNCATRARIIIEHNLEGPINYDSVTPYNTLRDLINHYTENHPWARFGISLLVASPADAPAPYIDQLFAPEMMMEAFATATVSLTAADTTGFSVTADTKARHCSKPLVEKTGYLTDINPSITHRHFPWPHPLIVFWALFTITILITCKEYRKRRHSWLCDGMIFGITGLAGLIIFVMNFFSAHPAVDHNWLLLWLQPAHLILAIALLFPAIRKSKVPAIYYCINLPFMIFALAGFIFLPQYFEPAFIPILLILICRCMYGLSVCKSNRSKTNRSKAIISLAAFLFLIPSKANSQPGTHRKGPALVVGIYLDQVEEDYLRYFFDGMEDGGLKKLLSGGRLYTDVTYNTICNDDASITASIVTGAPPLYHGIIGNAWLDTKSGTLSSCVYDDKYIGNYTSSTFSPQNILVSTIGDELRDGTMNHAKVFSIGIDAASAIVSGGQQANGVYWLDDESGLWCTSTYYKDMPRWIENLNTLCSDNAIPFSWTPRFTLDRYRHMPHQHNSLFFTHLIKGGDRGRLYKQTPMANSRVLQFAKELISNERLGDDDYPDILNLHLNLGDIMGQSNGLSSMEIEDFYFCLDEDLADFIADTDKKLGSSNVLYYVVGTGINTYPIAEGKNIRTFSPDRCGVLLNLYLSALHGDGKWVLGQTDRDIYLDRTLINEKGLVYSDVCREAAELVAQIEGVQQVTITQDFMVSHESGDRNSLHNSFCKGRSGDLMFIVETGRNIVWDSYPTHNRLIRQEHASTFISFYGDGIKPLQEIRQISIFDIAPTLCRLLYVRAPSASQGSALFTL